MNPIEELQRLQQYAVWRRALIDSMRRRQAEGVAQEAPTGHFEASAADELLCAMRQIARRIRAARRARKARAA